MPRRAPQETADNSDPVHYRTRARVVRSEHSSTMGCLVWIFINVFTFGMLAAMDGVAGLKSGAPTSLLWTTALLTAIKPLNHYRERAEAWASARREFGGGAHDRARRERQDGKLDAQLPLRGKATCSERGALLVQRACWTRRERARGIGRILRPLVCRERTIWRPFAIRTADSTLLIIDAAELILAHDDLWSNDQHTDNIVEVHDGDDVVVYGDWERCETPRNAPYRDQLHGMGLALRSACVVVGGARLTSRNGLINDAIVDCGPPFYPFDV